MPKQDRFLIGAKVDELLLESLIAIRQASYAPQPQKSILLQKADHNTEAVKIIVRLAHRLKLFSVKQYAVAQNELQEIGNMLGGWLRSPPQGAGRVTTPPRVE